MELKKRVEKESRLTLMILSVLISASIEWFDMQNEKEDINNTCGGKNTERLPHT